MNILREVGAETVTTKKRLLISLGIYLLFVVGASVYTFALIRHVRRQTEEEYEPKLVELAELQGQYFQVVQDYDAVQMELDKYQEILDLLTDEDLAVIKALTEKLQKKHTTLPREQSLYALTASMVASKYHGVNFNYASALIWCESTFRVQVDSYAQCKGLTQVSSLVWRVWGKKYGMDAFSIYNPFANAIVGIGYYGELRDSHSGNISRALAFYNGGSVGGASSRQYASKVISVAKSFSN